MPGSDALTASEVEQIWSGFISGARHYAANGDIVVDTCADGTGVFLVEPSRTGHEFTWYVQQDPGGRWSSAYARLEFPDRGPSSLITAGAQIPLNIEKDGTRSWPTYAKTFLAETFDSPDC
jgi:hypothetical protein